MEEIKILKATSELACGIYEIASKTIRTVYPKYYTDEVVEFFLELHNIENIKDDILQEKVYIVKKDETVVGTGTLDKNHITRVYILPEFQGEGLGGMLMDFLEGEVIKNYGDVWLDSSLPANGFYYSRGYVAKEHKVQHLKNEKILAYEVMCKRNFKINSDEYNAPLQLVRREMELQGINLDELRKIFPKRLYLLADSLYDTMLSKNAGTLTYHVGGEVYVMNNNSEVGFVKGEMCSPGIATQGEDLIAAGVKELIHVGFAGGHANTRVGDYVITDGVYHDTSVAPLYGLENEFIESSKSLTDTLCKEMDLKNIAYHRGIHWTTDAGYVQPNWRAKYYIDKGIKCVEMEGAGLFSVAKFRSCKATGIYVISDTNSDEEWNLGWGEDVLEKSIDKLIEAIIN